MSKKIQSISNEIKENIVDICDFLDGKDNGVETTLQVGNEKISIVKIRKKLNMSRTQFAKTFHLTPRSIENWEKGFRKPNNTILAYLKLIYKEPELILNLLNS